MQLIEIVLSITMILGQFFAAGIAFATYLKDKLGRPMLLITLAFVLMGLRRITALLIGLSLIPKLSGTIGTWDRLVLPLVITALLVVGVWELKKSIDHFEILDRHVGKKLGYLMESKKDGFRII